MIFCHQLKLLTLVSSVLISSLFLPPHLKNVIKSKGIQKNRLIIADEYKFKLNNIIIYVISTKNNEKIVEFTVQNGWGKNKIITEGKIPFDIKGRRPLDTSLTNSYCIN